MVFWFSHRRTEVEFAPLQLRIITYEASYFDYAVTYTYFWSQRAHSHFSEFIFNQSFLLCMLHQSKQNGGKIYTSYLATSTIFSKNPYFTCHFFYIVNPLVFHGLKMFISSLISRISQEDTSSWYYLPMENIFNCGSISITWHHTFLKMHLSFRDWMCSSSFGIPVH